MPERAGSKPALNPKRNRRPPPFRAFGLLACRPSGGSHSWFQRNAVPIEYLFAEEIGEFLFEHGGLLVGQFAELFGARALESLPLPCRKNAIKVSATLSGMSKRSSIKLFMRSCRSR